MNALALTDCDRFPVRFVTLVGDGVPVPSCEALDTRVIIEGTRMRVWVSPGEPLLDVQLDPSRCLAGSPRIDWRVTTLAGDQYLIRSQRGCGCSNLLKRWKPDTEPAVTP